MAHHIKRSVFGLHNWLRGTALLGLVAAYYSVPVRAGSANCFSGCQYHIRFMGGSYWDCVKAGKGEEGLTDCSPGTSDCNIPEDNAYCKVPKEA